MKTRLLRALPWLVVALPALYQIGLLANVIGHRVLYPFDLEWMEGGMLVHAQRIHDGLGIYGPPSVDFIPYLYTPLYPAILAMLGGWFGLGYALGRVISVLSLIGVAITSAAHLGSRRHAHEAIEPWLAGWLLALGLFAAAYPYVEGWYDLVRADMMFLFMITAAIGGMTRWASIGSGLPGHARVAAGAAILALAFFAKQTGIIYVLWGGAIVLAVNWRRLPIYIVTAGAIGLGGVWLLNTTTKGWFWIYIRKVHAAHDFNMDRFWASFGYQLWHFRAMTVVVAVALLVVLATRIVKGTLPRATHALLLWAPTYAVSVVVGCIGWGTEFAVFNAYMPAFLHGALAAGAALSALYACARVWWADRPHGDLVAHGVALLAAVPLALACWVHRWDPKRYLPTDADRAAGARLIERIRRIDGDVWMPSHTWYPFLAGKGATHVHRMGIKDVTTRQDRVVVGLDDALRTHRFSALILDDRDVHQEVPAVQLYYRPAMQLPADERPRVFNGAPVAPASIWVPAIPSATPPGATSLFDFEMVDWAPWALSGAAWGKHPEAESPAGLGLVMGAGGRRFATSFHDSDAATGRVTSPPFALDGSKLTLRLGGGTDASKLRVELWSVDAPKILATASVPEPGGDTLREVTLDVRDHEGKRARLVLVDDSPTSHLDVDDVWLWR